MSYFRLEVVWLFNRIRQVAPTAQKRVSHAGFCRAFLVYSPTYPPKNVRIPSRSHTSNLIPNYTVSQKMRLM